MSKNIDIQLVENFLQTLTPNGTWTPTDIYKKDDGKPDFPVVYTSYVAEILAIHADANLYCRANETKRVWKKARVKTVRERFDADYGIAERSYEYCGAHP